MRRCLVKGSVLRSVACLPTHPVLPIAPSQRIYIIHRDLRMWEFICVEIYMGVCMCGGESERSSPCGCAAYMWICGIVCVVAGERERERGGGEGGEGVGRNNNNPSSKPLDKHSTPIDRH